jgi:hypothetical protein
MPGIVPRYLAGHSSLSMHVGKEACNVQREAWLGEKQTCKLTDRQTTQRTCAGPIRR